MALGEVFVNRRSCKTYGNTVKGLKIYALFSKIAQRAILEPLLCRFGSLGLVFDIPFLTDSWVIKVLTLYRRAKLLLNVSRINCRILV